MLPALFKALSDETRREILCLLQNGAMNAGSISEELKIAPNKLTYHLNLLKEADLILEYKVKNYVYYEQNITLLDEAIIWLENLKQKR
ncbi:ArsR family transcriptional regulator [Petralouisia muris]|uniref:ArsR family transcriptional regulator n=1 Tax=Petralouisia muris TaxID=3032872 RepID=A0AC61RNJ6_9FIRM|nr:metalloregulator ArsR/SmtB family transcription factor [Petralouisia muris]TGY88731.1 ArsR family transcriptional regulator [Petralouisia muris]